MNSAYARTGLRAIPDTHSTLAPPALLQTFIVATAVTTAVFRVVLGAGCAIAFKKLA